MRTYEKPVKRAGRPGPGRGSVSLRRIGEETGLAVPTVSRILRGLDQCLPETRERVQEVASRLGYRPNLLVHALQTGRSNTVGVMVYVGGEFGARLAVGIHEGLKERDCLSLLAWTHPTRDARDPSDELDQIHRLLDRRVDAVILHPRVDTVDDCYLSEVWKRDIPLVTVDHELPKTHADFVGTDDVAGGRLAAEHLLALGHRVCAHIAGPSELLAGLQRREGFEQAIAACPGATCVSIEDTTFGEGAADAARHLLELMPRPTAIFCSNDLQARELYHVAAQRGLTIPDDLSVVGFADLTLASDLHPPLTTLRQMPEAIGRRAAAFVLDRRDGRWSDPTPRKERLMPELIERGSTGPVRAAEQTLRTI